MKKGIGALLAAVFLLIPISAAGAEDYRDPDQRFTVEVPEGWAAKVPQHEGVAASFGEAASGAAMNIAVREGGAGMRTEDLLWEDLFAPMYEAVDIQMEGLTTIDGEKAKYCLYTLRKGPFKKQMEGQDDLMHLNYVMVRNEELYSVTFTAPENAFVGLQPAFFKMVRSLNFPDPV